MLESKLQAAQGFIEDVENGNFSAIIIKDKDGDFFNSTSRTTLFEGDTVVYSYGGFVNSSANLEAEEIATRLK